MQPDQQASIAAQLGGAAHYTDEGIVGAVGRALSPTAHLTTNRSYIEFRTPLDL